MNVKERNKRAAVAVASVKDDALRFGEADLNGDQELDLYELTCELRNSSRKHMLASRAIANLLGSHAHSTLLPAPFMAVRSEEFYAMQPRTFREQHGPGQIRKWFDAADLDRSGRLSIDEFFRWTVGNAAIRHGAGSLKAAFEKFDKDKTGEIDALEFGKLCDELGFGAVSHELFRQLDQDQSGAILYTELLQWVQDTPNTAFSKQLLTSMVWSADEAKSTDKQQFDTSGWVLKGQSAKEIRAELQQLLGSSGAQVADLLGMFNESGSANLLIDDSKFHVTMRKLGYRGMPHVLDDIFQSLDADGSGSIGYDELFEFVRGYRHSLDARSKAVNGLKFRAPPPATSLAEVDWNVETLRMMLIGTLEHAKIGAADVMKAWDRSGDLSLNRGEWINNIHSLFRTAGSRLWQEEVFPVVEQSFIDIQKGGDIRATDISIMELERWLAAKPKMKKIKLKTRKKQDSDAGDRRELSLVARADQAIEAGKRKAASRKAAEEAVEEEKITRWKLTQKMQPNGQRWDLPPLQRWEIPKRIEKADFRVGVTPSSPMNAKTLTRLGSSKLISPRTEGRHVRRLEPLLSPRHLDYATSEHRSRPVRTAPASGLDVTTAPSPVPNDHPLAFLFEIGFTPVKRDGFGKRIDKVA